MPRSILIADDTLFMRRLLRDVLRPEGYVVREAMNGRDTLEFYDQFRPDLVMLDLALPDMDGMAVLKALLARDPGARVLVVSAMAADVAAPSALREGAVGYLEKPFQPAQLVDAVRCALSPAGA
jgi:two-component system chemotaxis response regulator CheY